MLENWRQSPVAMRTRSYTKAIVAAQTDMKFDSFFQLLQASKHYTSVQSGGLELNQTV